MFQKKLSMRAECRQRENLRVQASPSLADTFQHLKSLTVDLTHFGPEGRTRTSEVKYTVNLNHAKSLFRISCLNQECVGGDFDLSAALADAINTRQKIATGELTCTGWRSKIEIDRVRCNHLLRYKLTIGF